MFLHGCVRVIIPRCTNVKIIRSSHQNLNERRVDLINNVDVCGGGVDELSQHCDLILKVRRVNTFGVV